MISLNLLSKISFFLSVCFHLSFSSMGSNFHYSIDLNEDQNHHEQPFFYPFGPSSSILHNQQQHHHHHQVPSNSSSSISSLSSYLPFLINSQEDQHVAYNNTYHDDHLDLSQPLKAKMFNGGSSSSYDHTAPKKERRLKLTIKKKDHHEGQTDFLNQNPTKPNAASDKWLMSPKMRLIKKTITNNKQSFDHTNNSVNNHKEDHYPMDHKTTFKEDHDEELKKVSSRMTTTATTENRYNTINENGYGNNNGVIRVCSDCNTTKTPLWRSGPRGPKSLCNACGIRQRKARRAAMAAAAATGDDQEVVAARLHQLPVKKKLQNKKKRSNGGDKYNLSPRVVVKTKKCKLKEEEDGAEMVARDAEISKSTTSSDSSVSSNKFCFDDLTIILSKSSAYQQVFPQDEKEAAILLMALSYGMVHG
ncbi:GATA transcription factor 21 isoform X2 [Raphanus sativus]|uniref:GATA transcription factor 21 isoform X2 n=1 Tax=Raphanus sativus TaxID=3726 RepID=A0A6J0MC99_RAPSA|nr:GATA transcription factor 21 isoform X2 [Raphanus sativus]